MHVVQLNGQKWIVIFIDIARIFPLDQSTIGLNWENSSNTIDRAVVVNTRNYLRATADNTRDIADNADTANHSATSKVEYIDYNNLPDDVKAAYLRKNNGTHINKDDIKKFQNDLTEDARGRQQKQKKFEFPKAKWTDIIYADRTYFDVLVNSKITSTWLVGLENHYNRCLNGMQSVFIICIGIWRNNDTIVSFGFCHTTSINVSMFILADFLLLIRMFE